MLCDFVNCAARHRRRAFASQVAFNCTTGETAELTSVSGKKGEAKSLSPHLLFVVALVGVARTKECVPWALQPIVCKPQGCGDEIQFPAAASPFHAFYNRENRVG